MVIIETSVFARCVKELLDDDQYTELQAALVVRPAAGDLIPVAMVCVSYVGRLTVAGNAAVCE